MIEPLTPGLYEAITFEDYRKINAINASSLKYLHLSPAHYAYYKANPWQGSDSTLLGSVAHTLILEPDNYTKEYYVMPDFEPIKGPTKTGTEKTVKTIKAQELEYELANARGRTQISEVQKVKAFEMAEAVQKHKLASSYLLDTKRELTAVFESPYGMCKARLDAYKPGVIVDLKSCAGADYHNFAQSVTKFRYYLSAGLYSYGMSILKKPIDKFVFIAVENVAPFGVQVYELDQTYINYGIEEALDYLETLSDCNKKGSFPGYPERELILTPPSWLVDKFNFNEEEYNGN